VVAEGTRLLFVLVVSRWSGVVVRYTRLSPAVRVLFDPAGAASELEVGNVIVLDDAKPVTPAPLLSADLLAAFVVVLREPLDVDVPAEEEGAGDADAGAGEKGEKGAKASPPPTPAGSGSSGDDAHGPAQPSISTLAGTVMFVGAGHS
jgi:hypothetical protein